MRDGSSSSSSESSEDEEDVARKQREKRALAAKKATEAAKAALSWTPNKSTPTGSQVKTIAGSDGAQALAKGKPFQRVDSDYWGDVAQKHGGAMADNSYEGAFGESGFGAKSSEKLLQVRGKDFQREKTKRKRSFNGFARTGGQINTDRTFSTKFTYSDDEVS